MEKYSPYKALLSGLQKATKVIEELVNENNEFKSINLHDTYITQFPDIDELDQEVGLNRLSPFLPLNPLKGNFNSFNFFS